MDPLDSPVHDDAGGVDTSEPQPTEINKSVKPFRSPQV